MALSPFALGAELAMCQRCSGRTAEKDGDDGKDAAAGSSGKRERMGQQRSSQKGEDRTAMKKEAELTEVHLAQWISVEHREEVHEKKQRKVRYLLWDRAQVEEGGNGGAVQ